MTRRTHAAAAPLSVRAVTKVCLIVLAALATLPVSVHAQGVLPREQLQALIDESTQALQKLIAARDQPPDPALAFKQDRRGRTPTDDLKEHLLRAEVQQKLEAAQIGATNDFNAGDLPGVQIHLAELRQGLKEEIERYHAITAYWREPVSLPYVEGAARKATLKANGIRTPNLEQIETLSSRIDKEIAAGDFVAAMNTTWPELDKLRKEAKSSEYQQLLAKVDGGALEGFRSATPSRKCSPPNGGQTSKADTPGPRPDFPPTSEYFPTSMKRQGIRSGSPEVFVVVSAEGCPERAVLVGPSEHEEFDDAALRLAVDGHYYPAEKDGKPIRAGFYMRVSFYDLS